MRILENFLELLPQLFDGLSGLRSVVLLFSEHGSSEQTQKNCMNQRSHNWHSPLLGSAGKVPSKLSIT
jgi:hypothetical protein